MRGHVPDATADGYCAIADLDYRQLLGKPCGTPYFDERLDHRVGHLVRIFKRRRRRTSTEMLSWST